MTVASSIALAAGLLVSGCYTAQEHPGAIECKGKASLSGVGNVSTFSGANGSVIFDCGDGAYIRQGQDINQQPPASSPGPEPGVQP